MQALAFGGDEHGRKKNENQCLTPKSPVQGRDMSPFIPQVNVKSQL